MAEPKVKRYLFKINGTNVSDYVLSGSKIQLSKNNITGNTATIALADTVSNILTITAGMEITVSRGITPVTTTQNVFKGEVKAFSEENNIIIVTCKDKLQQLKYLLLTKSYDKNIDPEAGEPSAIFEDIVTGAGFTASVVSSGTSATDIVLDKFISRKNTRLNRLDVLSKILGWYFYYSYDNDWVRLEPQGTVSFGTALVVGTNVFNVPKWETNIESMRNKITINGAVAIDNRQETEVGDNSETTFNFTYEPESTNLTVDGVLQKLGVLDSTETYDYTVDKELKRYTFVTAPTVGQAILMNYQAFVPTPVTGDSPSSIAKYNLTQEASFNFDDIVTVADAEIRLTQLLALLEDGFTSTTIMTDEIGITPGMQVDVIDTNSTANNGSYIVESVVINYPDPLDAVKIGNETIDLSELMMSIDERIKALENTNTGLTDLLREVISFLKVLKISRYYFSMNKQKICDSFILDHFVNGLLDQGTFLDVMESGNSGNWSGSNFTISDESTIKQQGTGSMKAIWAGGAATGTLTTTQSFGDVSEFTGVASGTPSKGTVGLWVYVSNYTDISDMKLRLGSGASDYTEMSALAYASVDGYENWDNLTLLFQAGWNYIIFDLDNGTEVGTPDWTACDYARFEITMIGSMTIYFDYFTISKSNYIGLNGLDKRTMTKVEGTDFFSLTFPTKLR